MRHFKILHLAFMPLFFLTTCHVPSFYTDPDDPGLSRFTSRGGYTATSYIDGRPYMTTGFLYPLLHKDSTGNPTDTLQFAWNLYPNDSLFLSPAFDSIAFLMPVPQFFNKMNLLAFNGQRFLNSVPLILKDSSLKILSGIGTLYFVSVKEDLSHPPEKYILLSGLFDGNIGDSVYITKGRFDFQVDERNLNF